MGSGRVVWSGYKPFYENALAKEEPLNPVEIMGYLPFSSPYSVIRGIGAKVSDDDLSTLCIWTAEIQEAGNLGPDSGPTYFSENTELEASVRLPSNMVAVAWGLKVKDTEVSNIVIWARRWDPSTLSLTGSAVPYNYSGDNDVEMSTPVPQDTQQIIMGIGGGCRSKSINRIAAGYATLGMSPSSSQVPVIWGSVDSLGREISGLNFSSKKVSTGVYQLTWNNDHTLVPVVGLCSGVSSGDDNGSANVLSFTNVTTGGCTVHSMNVGGNTNNLQDEAFSFAAFFPYTDIPGLLYGSVDEFGVRLGGSSGWMSFHTDTGQYIIEFDRPMDPEPTLIMTSGARSNEPNGSDNVISNDLPSTTQTKVFSKDVGDGDSESQDQRFSFFAWNLNVLPTDPLTRSFKVLARHRITPDGQFEGAFYGLRQESRTTESVYSVADSLGNGHWRIDFNFPTPEVPIVYTCPYITSGESSGAKRITSTEGVTENGYETWSVKVGNGRCNPTDGGVEITVALPDQFPI